MFMDVLEVMDPVLRSLVLDTRLIIQNVIAILNKIKEFISLPTFAEKR